LSLKVENTKGVVLIRYIDGREKVMPKIAYLRMKKAGVPVILLKEALHAKELK
jgi:hypothetical protein